MVAEFTGYDAWKTAGPAEWDIDMEGEELEAADWEEEQVWTEVPANGPALYAEGFLEWEDLTPAEQDRAGDLIFGPLRKAA